MGRQSILFLVLSLAGTTVFSEPDLDLEVLKKNIQVFEGIVHQILKHNFPSPFALTAEPEGSYLEGYGVVIFFHLNINRPQIRTPFGLMPSATEKRPKEEQLKILKDSMIRCLADHGSTFKQLSGQQRISINAYVEDRNERQSNEKRTVLVTSASKESVHLFVTQKISFEKFKEQTSVIEY